MQPSKQEKLFSDNNWHFNQDMVSRILDIQKHFYLLKWRKILPEGLQKYQQLQQHLAPQCNIIPVKIQYLAPYSISNINA